jgi:hypothetical protein
MKRILPTQEALLDKLKWNETADNSMR